MWVVVAFPPMVIPWGADRPNECPKCGCEGSVHIHERVTRNIPYSYSTTGWTEADAITRYSSVRFRCNECGSTFSVTLSDRAKGFRLQKHVQARIVTWYSLGDIPSKILFNLRSSGIWISRATIHRVIKAADDGILRSLHFVNRVRHKRGYRRGSPFKFFQAGEMPRSDGQLAEALAGPIAVFSQNHEFAAGVAIVRYVVDIFFMYGDYVSRVTTMWLDNYLATFGNGAALTYNSLDKLEREFRPDEQLSGWGDPNRFIADQSVLDGPFDKNSQLFRSAVKTALRLIGAEGVSDKNVKASALKWKNKWAALALDDVPDEDVFDDVRY